MPSRKQIIKTQLFIYKVLAALTFCDAITRKGEHCRLKPVPGKKRCRFHGGKSTGPKTEEGRQRIAEASRERMKAYWKKKRQEKGEMLF